MSRIGFGTAIILALPMAIAAGAARAESGSDAYGLSASFTSSQTTTLGPVNEVSGRFPPAYSHTRKLASYTGSVTLPPLVPDVHPVTATFSATANHLVSSVVSNGIQTDFLTTSATASVGSTSLHIVPIGPPVPVPVGFLDIESTSVTASASHTLVFPSNPSVTGSASLAGVAISGSLLDGHTVTFSGSPAPNTVLFQNANLTIVANEQIAPITITCQEVCRTTPISITVHSLAVHITGAFIENGHVDGIIVLGSAEAN